MVHLNVRALLERDAVETRSQAEHAVDNLRQFEVGAQHLGVEIVLAHLQLVRVETEVPWFHHEVVALGLLRLAFQRLHLLNSCRLVSVDEVVEQLVHVLGVRRHAMHEHVVGVCLVAQQLRYLAAQVYEALAYLEVVLCVVVCALGVARHVELAAQLALSGVGHERRVARIVEREEPALLLCLLSSESRRFACRFGQSVELCFVCNVQRERLVLLQQVLRELQREQTCLLREVAQALLSLVVEQRTAAHETVVAVVEQHLLLGGQLAMVLVYVLDALEETLVKLHVVGVLCEYRTHLLRQSIQLVASLGAEHAREHGRHA